MLYDFSKDIFDIVVLAGQSNAVGFGFGSVNSPFLPNRLIWQLTGNTEPQDGYNHDYVISQARESVWGNETVSNFALSFADLYVKSGYLEERRKLLILQTAVGGTSFLEGLWDRNGVLYLRMLDMIQTALALNPQNRLVAFLWHQGKTDAALGASYETHYQNLSFLLDAVRQTFHVPRLPFCAADFVYHWKEVSGVDTEPVLSAIRDVCREAGNARFIETANLLSNLQQNNRIGDWEGNGEDTIHFSRSALYELGRRYFIAYLDIINKINHSVK